MNTVKQIIEDTLSDKPISRNELLRIIKNHGHNIGLRTLRIIISEMNMTGSLISRTTDGYKLIKTEEDFSRFEKENRAKAVTLLHQISTMKRTFEKSKISSQTKMELI